MKSIVYKISAVFVAFVAFLCSAFFFFRPNNEVNFATAEENEYEYNYEFSYNATNVVSYTFATSSAGVNFSYALYNNFVYILNSTSPHTYIKEFYNGFDFGLYFATGAIMPNPTISYPYVGYPVYTFGVLADASRYIYNSGVNSLYCIPINIGQFSVLNRSIPYGVYTYSTDYLDFSRSFGQFNFEKSNDYFINFSDALNDLDFASLYVNYLTFRSMGSDTFIVLAFLTSAMSSTSRLLSTNFDYDSIDIDNSYNDGYSAGYSDGASAGELIGYDNGYNIGYNSGYNTGKNDGYQEGVSAGEITGYNKGYNAGIVDGNDYSFFALLTAVIDVPVNAFTSLFSFDFLGVNIANFILSLFTLAVVLMVLKKIL